jgi:hypothetical protein
VTFPIVELGLTGSLLGFASSAITNKKNTNKEGVIRSNLVAQGRQENLTKHPKEDERSSQFLHAESEFFV